MPVRTKSGSHTEYHPDRTASGIMHIYLQVTIMLHFCILLKYPIRMYVLISNQIRFVHTFNSVLFIVAYNEKVITFLRQPSIMDILKEKHATLGANQSLRNKVNLIRSEGIEALDRMSADIELIILLR